MIGLTPEQQEIADRIVREMNEWAEREFSKLPGERRADVLARLEEQTAHLNGLPLEDRLRAFATMCEVYDMDMVAWLDQVRDIRWRVIPTEETRMDLWAEVKVELLLHHPVEQVYMTVTVDRDESARAALTEKIAETLTDAGIES